MPTEESFPEEFELRPGFRDDLYMLPVVFLAATAGPGHPPETRTPARGPGLVPDPARPAGPGAVGRRTR